ncbi:MAG: hypothetical protein GEU71_16400 [Actinobacteria bacterium]|nr:hypothetical protein [Actinomycetota bacterium]
MAQAIEATKGFKVKENSAAHSLDRSLIDRLISSAGAVIAVALFALGGAAIYGGNFALDNVRDRLEPQNITFPPAEAMSDFDKAEGLAAFAGQKVDTGSEAEAFSRYIGGHLAEVNEGKTYSETSSESRGYAAEVGENPTEAEVAAMAELDGKVQTLFRGETLRAILLNAYGWWTVGLITFFAGIGMVIAGLFLAVLVTLGLRHARKASTSTV